MTLEAGKRLIKAEKGAALGGKGGENKIDSPAFFVTEFVLKGVLVTRQIGGLLVLEKNE